MLPKPTRRPCSPPNSMNAILSAGIRTRPPFWADSVRSPGPSGPRSAASRSRSISAAVASVSTTSSRGMDWIPILTSTLLLISPLVGGAGPAADPAPGQAGHQLLGCLLGDRPQRAEPVPGADLGHADEADAQQMRLVVR